MIVVCTYSKGALDSETVLGEPAREAQQYSVNTTALEPNMASETSRVQFDQMVYLGFHQGSDDTTGSGGDRKEREVGHQSAQSSEGLDYTTGPSPA